MTYATYNIQDNKLRLYPDSRLPEDEYKKLKEAGFRWAPKQECFYAGYWSPYREDVLLEFVDHIEPDDMTREERAEERAERFGEYSVKRAAEAEAEYRHADELSRAFEGGQPILVGHHSEKKARKLAEKIERGMQKTINLWETASYWEGRAEASLRHAKYLEKPTVRHRRIKKLEAERRSQERDFAKAQFKYEQACRDDLDLQKVLNLYTLNIFNNWTTYNELKEGTTTWQEVAQSIRDHWPRYQRHYERWFLHYDNRIAYEKKMLGDWEAPKPVRRKPDLSPLVNFPGPGFKEMTAAEWKKANRYDSYYVKAFNADGTPAEWRAKGDYRQRVEHIGWTNPPKPVFITDAKVKYPEGYEAKGA